MLKITLPALKYGNNHQNRLPKKILIGLQGNKCFLCEVEFSKTSVPVLDHDHETGYIRGVLCLSCNSFISRPWPPTKYTSVTKEAYESYTRGTHVHN